MCTPPHPVAGGGTKAYRIQGLYAISIQIDSPDYIIHIWIWELIQGESLSSSNVATVAMLTCFNLHTLLQIFHSFSTLAVTPIEYCDERGNVQKVNSVPRNLMWRPLSFAHSGSLYDPCFISVVSPTRKKRNPAVWDSQTRSSLFPKAKVKLYSDKCGKSLFQESFLLVSFIDNMLVYFYPLSMRKLTPALKVCSLRCSFNFNNMQ